MKKTNTTPVERSKKCPVCGAENCIWNELCVECGAELELPYYFWDPHGIDPEVPGMPLYRQLLARTWQSWEIKRWGFAPNGLGDAAWRLGLYVACHGDDSVAVRTLVYLLTNRLRYLGPRPEKMVNAENKKRYVDKRMDYTRDQFVAGIFGLALAGKKEAISAIKIPLFLSPFQIVTPSLRAWVRFLQTGDEKYAVRFHRGNWHAYRFDAFWYKMFSKSTIPMYVRHLDSLMLFICPNPAVSSLLMERVNTDNIFLNILNDYNHDAILSFKAEEYQATKGWAAQLPGFQEGLEVYSEDEPIVLDKEFLNYIIELWIRKKITGINRASMSAALRSGSLKGTRN